MKEAQILRLRQKFKGRKRVKAGEIFEFWQLKEPTLKATTARWRIYELKKSGVLRDVAKGLYSFDSKIEYVPDLKTNNMKKVYEQVTEKFPYVDACIWSTQWLHSFMVHQPSTIMTIIEIDREAMNSVLAFLQGKHLSAMISPNKLEIERYVLGGPHTIIIKPLFHDAPTKFESKIRIPKLEKILVDIYLEKELFFLFQGKEMKNIFRNIRDEFSINETTLLSYAERRKRRDELKQYLNNIRDVKND